MPKITGAACAVVMAFALAGCAAAIEQKENMLVAAGFAYRPADTPEKVAALKAMPAHHFTHEMHKGQAVWLYADPTICGCIYAGDQAAYARYRQEEFQKKLADQAQMTAMMNEDAAEQANMNWGMWGGGPWGPYDY